MKNIRSQFKKLLMASLLLLPHPLLALTEQQVQHLNLLGKAWSVAKNYHSGACDVNWDAALLATMPNVLNASDDQAFNLELGVMLDQLGTNQVAQGTVPETPAWAAQKQDLSWLQSARLSQENSAELTSIIEDFRPRSNCFVTYGTVGEGNHETDAQYATVSSPSRYHRLLGLFRYWNIINTYFPYKHLIDGSWDDVLVEFIPRIYNTGSVVAYEKEIRLLTARIQDTHSFLYSNFFNDFYRLAYLSFILKTVEGKVVVYKADDQSLLGREVISINGVSAAELITQYQTQTAASNPSTMTRNTDQRLNRGTGAAKLVLKNSAGDESLIETSYGDWPAHLAQPTDTSYQAMDQATCSIGYVNMGLLESEEVPAMMSAFDDKDAIVFDLRNYPNGTLWALVNHLYEDPVQVATFVPPNLEYPGGFLVKVAPIGTGAPNPYSGRLIILMNEETQSQAEYTVMGLEQHPNAVKIGSQTAAADGNVTAAYLPGRITAVFTGMGVYYPDLEPTQRIGIVPDLFIRPSIDGVKAGRDEVLEQALNCENITNIAWPESIKPDSGLYWDPSKDGKGFDIHKSGEDYVAFAYDYREDGSPVWYLGVSAVEDGTLQMTENSMAEYRHDPDQDVIENANLSGTLLFDFKRGFLEPDCAVSSPENKTLPSKLTWVFGDTAENRCMEALLFSAEAPAENFTGLWDGGEGDNGWGISVNTQGDVMVVLLYFYDASGAATWLIGSTTYVPDQPVTMELQKAQGYCSSCDPTAVTYTQAGSLTLSLTQATNELITDNWLSLNLSEQSRWNRDQMPIRMITQPLEP